MPRAEPFSCDLSLPDPDATDRLGIALAERVAPGDTILLVGEIGAGKSHLARRLIQTVMPLWGAPPEDVPSPTYTLVQTYETPRAEIWHADLYRLGDPSEVAELGLTDAFEWALCLVEWPDRLADAAPPRALTITLTTEGDGRGARLQAPPDWTPRLERLW